MRHAKAGGALAAMWRLCCGRTDEADGGQMNESISDCVIRRVAELPDRTSPADWPEAMLVTADELRCILQDQFVVIGSGYEAGFDAGYAKGYADGLDESSGDPRVERLEAGFKAIQDATNGEYSREDRIV